ncbi:hypothetical protein VE25_01920, partial [Devosia geojensis]
MPFLFPLSLLLLSLLRLLVAVSTPLAFVPLLSFFFSHYFSPLLYLLPLSVLFFFLSFLSLSLPF